MNPNQKISSISVGTADLQEVEEKVKISVIMIVLNGMPFIKYALEAIYPAAHQIIIVEGAVENCLFSANPDGSSLDGTIEFIKQFPDSQNKIQLVQGCWPEKCEMQNKALEYVIGNYVWLVDSDEVYRNEDIAKITDMLAKDPTITQVNLICHNFWKGFDHIFVSNRLFAPTFHIRRIFKFVQGARFISHRPPTMVHPGSEKTTEQMHCVDGMSMWRQGIAIYHYSYVLDLQVRQKMELYRRYGWDKTWGIDMQRWYHEFFTQWSPDKRPELERHFPAWTGDLKSFTIPFKGVHPEVISDGLQGRLVVTEPSAETLATGHIVETLEELLFGNLPGPPLVALETGTIRSGDQQHESTLQISRTLGRGGKLFSVHSNSESIRIGRDVCNNPDNVEWIMHDPLSYLRKKCPDTLHFVLLASDQGREAVFSEFKLVAPHMAPDGIMIVDDVDIRADGMDRDESSAGNGDSIARFLNECEADFELMETSAGRASQVRVRFTAENAGKISGGLTTRTGRGAKRDSTKETVAINAGNTAEATGGEASQSRDSASASSDRHMVIDGVIFQLQAGRPHGISRVWLNLIPQLIRKLPQTKITVLQRKGFPVPEWNTNIHTVPAYRLGGEAHLDADDEMLRRVCQDLKADVFLSSYYTRAPGVTNVVMIHDLIPELFGFDLSQFEWQAKQRVIDTGDAFMCVSKTTQDDLIRCYPHTITSPMVVAPNGLDERFKPVPQSDILKFRKKLDLSGDYVLLVGNRQGYKGGVELLECLSQIPSRANFSVLCVGGEKQPSAREQVLQNKLGIRYAGQLSDTELAAAYGGAMALMVPSKYEGFGLPVIEAMACGCPVIVEKSPAIEEVGGAAVRVVDMGCPDTVHQVLQEIGDPSYREEMVHKGKIRAVGFNWGRTAERIGQFVMSQMDKPSILLTAVVSTYNSVRFIKGCLDDLVNQTIADRVEIIVVDSASEQGEAAIVRGFQKHYPNIKYIRTAERENVYTAWNRGIKLALGKYVTNANTDDRHRRDAFDKMIGVLEEDNEIALVYADVIKTHTANETFDRCTPSGVLRWPDWNREKLLTKGCFIGPQPVWRKRVHDAYGYFDTRYDVSSDFEFWLRISQTNEFRHLAVPLGLYLEHQQSVEHANADKKRQEDKEIFAIYRRAAAINETVGHCDTGRQQGESMTSSPSGQYHRHADHAGGKKSFSEAYIPKGGATMNSPETISKAIEQMVDRGEEETAYWMMEKLMADFPDRAYLHNNLAAMAYERSDMEKAGDHYKIAAELEPDNMQFNRDWGDFLYVVEKDAHRALTRYEKALSADPRHLDTLIMAGHVSISLHQYDQARQYYQRVMEIQPDNSDVQSYLEKLGAMAQDQKTGSMSPDELFEAAQLKIGQGDDAEAKSLLEQLVEMDDSHAAAHNDLGVLNYEADNMSSAKKHYERAAELIPESEIFQKNLADFYLAAMGDHQKAMQTYLQVLKLAPQDVDALLGCSQICIALGKASDAREFIDTALTTEPWNENALKLAELMDKQVNGGDCREDEACLYEKVRNKSSNADWQGAIDDLKILLVRSPDNAKLHNDLGVLHYENGDKEQALSCYEMAVQLAPEEHNYAKNLADFYLVEQNRAEDAIKIYHHILEENVNDVDALVGIGTVCGSLSRPEDAQHFYLRALDIEPWNEAAQFGLNNLVRSVESPKVATAN